MNILEVLVRLRDDLKLWVTNNLMALKEEVDSKSTFSGSYEDLTDVPDFEKMIEDAADSLDSDMASHKNNADIHVTKAEKDGWNDHAIDSASHVTDVDKASWNTHVGENGIHVTAEDKLRWNNKSEFSGNYNDLEDAPSISDDGEGDLKFVDEAGNIILQVDDEGLHTTNIELLDSIDAASANIDNLETAKITLDGEDILNTMDSKVGAKFAELVDSAPDTLDTLNELATALGNDPNFATTVVEQLGLKVNKADMPTKLSQFENDKEYLIEVPSEYATEDEVDAKINDVQLSMAYDLQVMKSDIDEFREEYPNKEYVDNELQDVKSDIDNLGETIHYLPSNVFTTTAGSSTSGAYLSTKWSVANVKGITEPYDGMTIAIRVPLAGVSTAGVVLSIDGGATYHPIVRNLNTVLSTSYVVGNTIIVTYNATQTATAYLTSNTKTTPAGVWQIADYDSDTKARSSQYTSKNLFIIGAATQSSSGQTTYSNNKCYIGTDSCLYSDDKKVVTGVGISSIVKVTQAEYDALATKDPNILYIVGDGAVNTDAATYDVRQTLNYSVSDNDQVEVTEGNSFATVITPETHCSIEDIRVTMDGVDITDSVVTLVEDDE